MFEDKFISTSYSLFTLLHIPRFFLADITIGALPNGPDRAKEFGLMKIDENRRVLVS
jgi:hypothetical protein